MPSKAEIAKAFALFDTDSSGKLSVQEILAILTRSSTGSALSLEDAQEIIDIFDEDDDGELDLNEFVEAFAMIADVAAGDDADASGEEDESAMPSGSAEFQPPEGWRPFELGVPLDQLKAHAPMGTSIDHGPMGTTIMGAEVSFVVTMEAANEFSLPELEAAVADFTDTYAEVKDVVRKPLADGYLFTAQNESGFGGTNFWLVARREIRGKAYSVSSTCSTPAQLANAVTFALSVRAPLESELL